MDWTDQNIYADRQRWMAGKTIPEIWSQCERADWLISISYELGAHSPEDLERAVRACAERARRFSSNTGVREVIGAWLGDARWAMLAPKLTVAAAGSTAVHKIAWAAQHVGGDEAWRLEHREMANLIRSILQQPMYSGSNKRR